MEESTMFNLKDNNILKFFTAFSLIVMLTACSSSNDGDAIVFDPTVAPQNVQVVVKWLFPQIMALPLLRIPE
jgi:hypothetical protein